MSRAVLLALLLTMTRGAASQVARPTPTRIDLGDGIYLFQTAPYSDVGLDGNTVAIVSHDGVLVFDSNGTPEAAAAVLAELRTITDQPVRYLVHSHWHWDHWYGAQTYRDAFPAMQIISHERTRALMAGPAIRFNQPGLDSQLPGHIAQVEARLAQVRDSAPASPAVARLERHVAEDRAFLEQKREARHVLATITFADSLTIHLGERVIKVLHHDRAITPGDAYLYLPAERVVVTGDLLINPITFALFCYPAGWIATLRSIAGLDARLLVPGHGAPLEDRRLLEGTTQLLEREREMARAARAAGRTVAEASAEILADPKVLALREAITGGDRSRDEAFALYLVDWFVRRVFQEAEGTLDDSIPNAP